MCFYSKLLIAVLIGVFSFSGYSLGEKRMGKSPLPRTEKSPFLGDLSKFVRQKNDPNLFIVRPSKIKAADYEAYVIDPVQIYISPNSPLPKLKEENRKMLEELFRSMAVKEVEKYHKIVDKEGSEVLRIRLAIQDARPGRYFMDKDGTHTIQPNTSLAGGTFELDADDSQSGERIVALFYQLEKGQITGSDKELKLKKVQDVFADWVRMLSEQLALAKIK